MSFIERRKTGRSTIKIKVRTRTGDEETFSRAANISMGGMFVNEVLPYRPGEVVEVAFLLPDDGSLVQAQATVIHARDVLPALNPDNLPGHGLRFLELDAESKDALAIYLDEEVESVDTLSVGSLSGEDE